jgi:hypothetical protein
MGEFHALALHTYTPQEWAEIGAARHRRPVLAVASTDWSRRTVVVKGFCGEGACSRWSAQRSQKLQRCSD